MLSLGDHCSNCKEIVNLHLQPCFNELGYGPGDFPNAERAAAEVIAIPVYPELEEAALNYVVETIRDFYRL